MNARLADARLAGLRTSLEPAQLLRTVPSVVKRLDANLPLEELKTLPQQVRENVFLDRMISMLAAMFAGLTTLLAAVGLYCVPAYTVAQRTREVALMTLVGGTLGIAAAIALGRAARSLLFGLEGHDPVVIVLAAVVLALVAFGAGYIPALRASRVDPMQALRYE